MLVDPPAHEARFNDCVEHLQPQTAKVLVALARRRGEVIGREELIDTCWGGRVVGTDVINRAILLLRGLGKRSGAFTIETVPKAGYRLIEVGRAADARRKRWPALTVIAAVALLAVGWLMYRNQPDQSHPPLVPVEVVPFASSGDPLAKETASASDRVVGDMLANSGLPVLKRSIATGRGQNADLRLSGQVRMVGSRVEATLQLDDLKHGVLLLSRRFNVASDQARDLPEQIGAFAATSLASTGSMMALDSSQPGDRRLTGELLRQWSMMIALEDAIGTYQAVDRIAPQMPGSAVAQLGLAMSTVHALPLLPPEDRQAALAKGRTAAARARSLAPNYGDIAWPDCSLYSPVRMSQCESALRKSFAIDPHSPFVAAAMRNHLVSVGRFREALDYDRLAVAAMPYMAGRLAASTMLLEGLGQRTRADQQFQRVRRWWPNFDQAFGLRIEGMLDRGSLEDAALFTASMPPDVDVIDRQAVASIAADVAAKRSQPVGSRCLSAPMEPSLAYFCLIALIRLDDMDGAFVLADRSFPNLMADDPKEEDRLFLEKSPVLGLGTLSTPAMRPLRQDPRFIAIAQRVGLMRYWRADHLPDFCTFGHEPICRIIARQ